MRALSILSLLEIWRKICGLYPWNARYTCIFSVLRDIWDSVSRLEIPSRSNIVPWVSFYYVSHDVMKRRSGEKDQRMHLKRGFDPMVTRICSSIDALLWSVCVFVYGFPAVPGSRTRCQGRANPTRNSRACQIFVSRKREATVPIRDISVVHGEDRCIVELSNA